MKTLFCFIYISILISSVVWANPTKELKGKTLKEAFSVFVFDGEGRFPNYDRYVVVQLGVDKGTPKKEKKFLVLLKFKTSSEAASDTKFITAINSDVAKLGKITDIIELDRMEFTEGKWDWIGASIPKKVSEFMAVCKMKGHESLPLAAKVRFGSNQIIVLDAWKINFKTETFELIPRSNLQKIYCESNERGE